MYTNDMYNACYILGVPCVSSEQTGLILLHHNLGLRFLSPNQCSTESSLIKLNLERLPN